MLVYAVGGQGSDLKSAREGSKKKGMILPFQPLTMTFHNVNYFVDMPKVCLSIGFDSLYFYLLVHQIYLMGAHFLMLYKTKFLRVSGNEIERHTRSRRSCNSCPM
jgi:hypothetical protein